MTPEEFVNKLVQKYNTGTGIFKIKVNAEELIPQNMDSYHKALFIFYVIQLDYAMKSQILYKGASELYKINNSFFTPDYITKLSSSKLSLILKKYLRPRYINEATRRYIHNTNMLMTKYDNDPREIFKNTKLCNDVIVRLKEFRGFGPKIGNFFVRTMINTFKYEFVDIETILPPVDIHDVRIAYLMGFTCSNNMSVKNINKVKNIWNTACINSNCSWLVFDKALWLLGSEGKPKSKTDIFKLID